MGRAKEVMNACDMERTLERLACQVLEQISDPDEMALIGIQRRGVDLACRLSQVLARRLGQPVACGELDINLYRDDWTTTDATPQINATHIDFSVAGKTIVVVDDVLFTGRTVRCALEAILDFGRPRAVKLLVLVDRGHRELPIQADFVGKYIVTDPGEQVYVFLQERDGLDRVVVE
ncbi:bifunctional pyr operon transcriptional regulator/uracil phosphoribosyltransferase PyrR [Desulfovibrionales bacterium]